MEIQPHAYTRGSRSALLLLSALALKISQVFVPQVWSITLLLLRWISPHLAAKIGIIFETTKKKVEIFRLPPK
jgi:hypothetical protein